MAFFGVIPTTPTTLTSATGWPYYLNNVIIMNSCTNATWQTWSNTTVSTTNIWTIWCTPDGENATVAPVQPRQLTDAEREHQQRLQDQFIREQAERNRVRQEAVARAERLLLEHLTPAQVEDYRARQFFVVEGPNGIRYRIRKGRAGNIDVVGRDGRIMHGLCVHPSDDVPDGDTMLAQKLYLEAGDEGFLRVANRQGRSPELVLPALVESMQ